MKGKAYRDMTLAERVADRISRNRAVDARVAARRQEAAERAARLEMARAEAKAERERARYHGEAKAARREDNGLNTVWLEKRAETARLKLKLTPEDVKKLQGYAHQVYEQIAYDLTPDNKRHRTCKRGTILEVVTDAGRLEQRVREGEALTAADAEHRLIRACRAYPLIHALIGPEFPYRDYEAGPYPDEELRGQL